MSMLRFFILALALPALTAAVQAQAPAAPAPGQSLRAAPSGATSNSLLNGGPAAWVQIPAKRIGLNRTPPLFETDEPAAQEISTADVRIARTAGKLVVQLSWRDATQDTATLAQVPNTPPETRFRKVQTDADDRFFDAAAVMFPARSGSDAMAPSLQMGDAEHPVEIYYWNAARGPMLMEAQGRGTTRRTGHTFPAAAAYQNGQWTVTFELPELSAGTPMAFAVWNGSQKDRDGRKYFSVWQVLE
ncbi:MAG TPA: ethylbenzene dehydrogenase-related protein [Terriglobales bacterium]|nr:ethylbenzene dehydrogenase-related protein [Terriglobales bacterium]